MRLYRWVKEHIIAFLALYVIPCDDMTRHLSDQMEHRPTWRQRLAMKAHLSICVWCRRYETQLKFLRNTVQGMATDPDRIPLPPGGLSKEARERIRRAADESQS